MIYVVAAAGVAIGLGAGALCTTILMARWFADLSDRLSSMTATSASHFTEMATSIATQVGNTIRETMRPYPVELAPGEFLQPPPAYEEQLAQDWTARTGRQPSWNPATAEFEFNVPDGWHDTTPGTIDAER